MNPEDIKKALAICAGDEQYVPVTTIDHIFSLLSSPERE